MDRLDDLFVRLGRVVTAPMVKSDELSGRAKTTVHSALLQNIAFEEITS